jgi:uncharacterized protein
MIIGFSVSNYRSFSIEQSLSFLASSDSSHEATHTVPTGFGALPRLNRSAVVFGPNGSGKSNLLRALRTMREIVLRSSQFGELELAELYAPFHGNEWRETPTVFTIDLLLEGVRYLYSFSYDAARITSEQLQVYKSHKSQRWFGRQFDPVTGSETWMPFSSGFPGPREIWRSATKPQSLFLTTASQLDAQALGPMLHWFEHQLDITLSSDVTELSLFGRRLRDPLFKSKVLNVLLAVDSPIADVRVTEAPAVELLAPAGAAQGAALGAASADVPACVPTIEFLYVRHGMAPIWVDSRKDSAGARRLVLLLVPLLDGIEQDKLVAIDEFDTHLHPLVARFLIQSINDPSITHHHVQVLLVSHTTTLMDLDILRRDELWLIELDEDYASSLRTLLEHRPRRHELVANAYLKGRYGALPKVDMEMTPVALHPQMQPQQQQQSTLLAKRKKTH